MRFYRVFQKIYEQAAHKMCQDCEQFIEQESKILDIGCGSAIVANTFQNFFDTEIVGADVIDRRLFPIAFSLIDGKKLPFPSKSFDNILIAYTLHHSKDPIFLLKEAVRVCRGKIFIYEDLPEGLLSKVFCKIHSFSFDKLFGNKNKTAFKTEEEWQEVFKALKLNLIFDKQVSYGFEPVKKKLFILEVSGD